MLGEEKVLGNGLDHGCTLKSHYQTICLTVNHLSINESIDILQCHIIVLVLINYYLVHDEHYPSVTYLIQKVNQAETSLEWTFSHRRLSSTGGPPLQTVLRIGRLVGIMST